jgi:glycosyltransferase involved in cell wall biosynthesis
MKITIDIRMLYASGVGIYIQNLVPRILKLRAGDQFCLLGKAEEGKDLEWTINPAVQWVDCHSPIYSLSQQWELKVKIPKDTDLLWIPHYDIPLFYKRKMLVTVHDLFHLAMPRFVGGIFRRLYAQFMFGQVVRKASAISVISEFTKRELIRFTGVNPGKIQVIPLGVDPFWFELKREEEPNPRPFLLYVGNIKPHKNLARLLEAFELLKDKVPHDLILVGQKEGFITGDIEVQRRAESFDGRVKFTGRVSQEELKGYYTRAEALVFPSLYEGFGLPPLEAMASRCPVAASNAASIPEVCSNAVLYFDPYNPGDMAEKTLRLIREKKLRDELVQKGLERAKKFSWDECASQTSALIDKIAASSPLRPLEKR